MSKKFRKFFHLSASPVAVRISDKEMSGPRSRSPMRFCEFVRKAAYGGEEHVITEKDLSNFTAAILLGFSEPTYVNLYPRIKPAKTRSIFVTPLEKAHEADVVIIIANPSRMMQVVQILHKVTKKRLEGSMTCEASAIAGEATALPYMEKRPNLTLLCGGARTLGGYQENELAIGIPFDTFTKLVDSLAEPTLTTALCGCLMDELPGHVKDFFSGMGFDKGTDHFFGEFQGETLRLYISKDERGVATTLTTYCPLRLGSEEEARKAEDVAKSKLAGEGTAIQRENWLDLILTTEFTEGLEKATLDRKKFENVVKKILTRFVEIANEIKTAVSRGP
jgi:uncharacterized protein (DUF169 family)